MPKSFVVPMIWPGGRAREYFLVPASSKAEALRKMEREKNHCWDTGTRVGTPEPLRYLTTDKAGDCMKLTQEEIRQAHLGGIGRIQKHLAALLLEYHPDDVIAAIEQFAKKCAVGCMASSAGVRVQSAGKQITSRYDAGWCPKLHARKAA